MKKTPKSLMEFPLLGGKLMRNATKADIDLDIEARKKIVEEFDRYNDALKQGKETLIKATIRIPKTLWRQARVRAIEEDRELQILAAEALIYYLGPRSREGSR